MKTLNRREFLSGTAITVAGAAALGTLAACAPSTKNELDEKNREGSQTQQEDFTPVETLEADVVVVGAGISGLAASVQAAELGMRVIQLEVNKNIGGNGLGTEGIFAIGSKEQQEMGIDLTLADIIAKEQDFFKYKVNALYWKDMVEQSAETLEWLKGNGVEFSGRVDDYPPLGSVKTMHWWKDGSGSSYIDPMGTKARDLGVDIRLETRGIRLIMEDSNVAGLYAKNSADEIIQINAPSVILATGGFADNPDKLKSAGVNPDQIFIRSFGGHQGDGLDMAVQAGAKDLSVQSAYLRETTIEGVDFATPFSMFFFTNGSLMWVNQEGERFADENCLSITSGCQSNANSNQDQTYSVFSQSILEAAGEDTLNAAINLLSSGTDRLIKAETVAELAAAFNIPEETLRNSLDRYNKFCDNRSDEDFGKNPEKLTRIDAPFYIAKMSYCYMSSIGGIRTSRRSEVISAEGNVIPGLYAVGSDGCELYAGTYTISVCSSYNGNNVYSGRNAARNAFSYVSSL